MKTAVSYSVVYRQSVGSNNTGGSDTWKELLEICSWICQTVTELAYSSRLYLSKTAWNSQRMAYNILSVVKRQELKIAIVAFLWPWNWHVS